MAEPFVREVGRMGPPSHPLIVGVDEDTVTIGTPTAWWGLNADQAEEFSRLFVAAVWQAAQQAGRTEGASDG